MRQRQPYRAQLQQTGGARIEHPPRNIDVRHGVAVKQHVAIA